MRIFHGHDYYDGIQGTGYESLVFQRREDHAVAPMGHHALFNIGIHNERYTAPVHLMPKIAASPSLAIAPFHILLGQTVYHGACIFDDTTHTMAHICHDRDAMHAHLSCAQTRGHHHITRISTDRIRFGTEPLSEAGQSIARTLGAATAVWCGIIPPIRQQPPSAPWRITGQYTSNRDIPIYINPPWMKYYRMQDILDPMQAYQDIQMSVRDHLNPEHRAITPSNDERIAKHGMDHTSFRRPKRT